MTKKIPYNEALKGDYIEQSDPEFCPNCDKKDLMDADWTHRKYFLERSWRCDSCGFLFFIKWGLSKYEHSEYVIGKPV